MTQQYPLIGTGVVICKDGKVLVSKRSIGKSGAGTWHFPGGHVELYETIANCAVREVREETGLEIGNLTFLSMDEDFTREDGKHYVTFIYRADWKAGEPVNDPRESEEWHWFSWNELPEPLFWPSRRFVEKGINPLEFKG